LDAQLSLERALQTSDDQHRYLDLERHDRGVVRAREAYDHYREVAPGGAGERRLRAAFETIRAAWLEVASDLKAAATQPAPLQDPVTVRSLATARARFEVTRKFAGRIDETFYAPAIRKDAPRIVTETHRMRVSLTVVVVAGLAIGFVVSRTSVRATQAQQRAIEERDRQREADSHRNEYESRLHRALEMAKTEDAALDTITKALDEAAPGAPIEVLLADSSRAHLRQALSTDRENRGPGCQVPTPSHCPAVNRGQTLVFETSGCFDACPYLRDRGGEARSAVCVPVSIMGMAAGVLHATGPDQLRPDKAQLFTLEQVAAKAGERIGLLRAFSRSEAQAASDPLTGLPNRRSLEERVQDLRRAGSRFAVAYGDLDHFKLLNDTHGHETGDRALRLFARVLQESLRDDDIPARWGGEEFVVVLPSITATDAAKTLERVQESLAVALASGNAPHFTVSFGVCGFDDADEFEELIDVADGALLAAKRAGRNRVVVAGLEPTPLDRLDDEAATGLSAVSAEA
jgi:diguanylate cyclase (GGDEF)-like protein